MRIRDASLLKLKLFYMILSFFTKKAAKNPAKAVSAKMPKESL